jgi:hypothetical protein
MSISDLMSLETVGPIAFISIFHVIGGVALGITLRGWVNNPTRENLFSRTFFLIWGGMFGCMPLVFGIENGTLVIQIVVLLIAIAVPFMWLEQLREMFSDQNVVMVGFGGIFLISGLVAGGALLREREWLFAVLFGGIFSLVGGSIFFAGLRNLLRGTPGDE